MNRPLLAGAVLGMLAGLVLAQPKAPPDPLDGPPFVTAKSWVVADGKSGEVLWGVQEATPRPMASTSKIMTAWIVLQLAAADVKVLEELVTISARADKTSGSTADVQTDEKISVHDLLHGLLLPSGNDAAVALAEHFGKRFVPAEGKDKQADPHDRFVAEMNHQAEKLKLKETKYLDPHGLGLNRTSARDLARLTWTALQDPLFRKYVQTRAHTGKAEGPDGKRDIAWKNTNQLLDIEGYEGVKTGTTVAAGACLVSSGRRGNDHLLIVVLGSTSPDARYTDTRNLFRWAWLKRGHKS